ETFSSSKQKPVDVGISFIQKSLFIEDSLPDLLSRSSGSHRDVEDEELTRIFVMIPRSFSEEDVKETFKVYRDIEYAIIIRNKTTGESKGLGYVRFHKPSQAAKAIENCDKTFRAILAGPRTKNASADNDYFMQVLFVVLSVFSPVGKMAMQLVAAQMMSMVWNGPSGAQLMKTSAGYTAAPVPQKARVQTDVDLPPLKKLVASDSVVKERLFVIFNPSPLPVDVLEDVFCRFGTLMEVYLVPGRNVGYIKYADRKPAYDAIALLHGKVINGIKMKVMLADPPKEESHKRQRTY
uniref:RNA binding motif protein 45 n=1 Tax=Sinocyclocheilus grahami TaxID=75366 RepID=A0A672RBZ0_SINGR